MYRLGLGLKSDGTWFVFQNFFLESVFLVTSLGYFVASVP
jgi:hypothetical protein